MERCISAFSARSTERGQKYSFEDVCARLSGNECSPVLIIFSSDFEDFMLYSDLFSEHFPQSQVIGTTSFFNCTPEGHSEKGLAALAIYSGIECAGGVLEECDRCPIRYIGEAETAVSLLGSKSDDDGRVCCLEFTTAFGNCEELAIDTLRKACGGKNIPLFGSSSGVRKGTKRSYVSFNGKVYVDACVFMFIRNTCGRISFVRENTYRHTDHFFQATNVDCERRVVYEINGRPAAEYLSSVACTDVPVYTKNINHHPIGRLYGDNIYITDGDSVGDDLSVSFYAHIYNYSRLVLLEPDDANRVMSQFFDKINDVGFVPSFSIAVNCMFDYGIFSGKGFSDDFIKKFGSSGGNYIGISGCGEQIDDLHINKTMLLAAFE